nr:hypothetical protein [Candidatus Sigynarchaeota archaeon]
MNASGSYFNVQLKSGIVYWQATSHQIDNLVNNLGLITQQLHYNALLFEMDPNDISTLGHLVVQRALEDAFGYHIENDLNILTRINGLSINHERVKEIDGYVYFEVFWERNPQYKMLCRVPVKTMTSVRTGVEVFWYHDGGVNIGPSIDFNTMMSSIAAGTWNVLKQRLLATGRITSLTTKVWTLLADSTDPFHLHLPPP